MKSLAILQAVLVDAHRTLGADTSRDFITIRSRQEHEGDSFLGITLPAFCSWFERSIEQGRVETSIYATFRRKSGGKSVLPCFLHGLTSLVFLPDSGLLREDADVNAVFFIRQISSLFKKEKALCSTHRVADSLTNFVEIENSIRKTLPDEPSIRGYVDPVSNLFGSRLESVYTLTEGELPRHGPGATSDGLRGNAKFRTRKFFHQWRNVFSLEEIYGFQAVDSEETDCLTPPSPVRVIAVPKTMKAARIIAVEDTAMQFAQQYVSKRLTSCFEKIGVMSQLNLADQSVNQRLALLGSKNGHWATLDLSEASDRLSARTVHHLFRSARRIRQHLFACRTPLATVDNKLLVLKKFASMGSALTFPVESYSFYIIALSAVVRWFDLTGQFSRSSFFRKVEEAARLVFVFGDDIIVPTDSTSEVVRYLQSFGLKVNERKSFSKGPFRESCGVDAYKGYQITPVYIRSRIPQRLTDATEFVSFVSTANQFYLKGMWYTADLLRKYLDSLQRLHLVSRTSNLLGWHTFQNVRTYSHFSKSGEAVLRSVGMKVKRVADRIDGYDALLKHFVSLKPYEDPNHLQESVSRYSLRLRNQTGNP